VINKLLKRRNKMTNDINLTLYGQPYYKITGDCSNKKIICHKECMLKIHDEVFLIKKKGTVHSRVDEFYDEELLKAQAWAQASVKIGHEMDTLIEVYMVKKRVEKQQEKEVEKEIKCLSCLWFTFPQHIFSRN
jgi:CxxC motif-containing protein